MLRGIKERTEARPLVPPPVQAPARAGWALAGAGLLAVFLARRRRWPWLLLPAAPVVWSLALTGDADGALAGFLAVGATVAGPWPSAGAGGRRTCCSPPAWRWCCSWPRTPTPPSGCSSSSSGRRGR